VAAVAAVISGQSLVLVKAHQTLAAAAEAAEFLLALVEKANTIIHIVVVLVVLLRLLQLAAVAPAVDTIQVVTLVVTVEDMVLRGQEGLEDKCRALLQLEVAREHAL
jgi:hypothetical protein